MRERFIVTSCAGKGARKASADALGGVLDLTPIYLKNYVSSSNAGAVVGDWLNIRWDVRNAAWRVYVGG